MTKVPYSGKFSNSANFRIFRTRTTCRYLKPVTEGPNLCGPLSSTLTPATVKDANTKIKSCVGSSAAKPRGTYAKNAYTAKIIIISMIGKAQRIVEK